MGIVVKVKGDFKETKKFLNKMTTRDYIKNLQRLGERGVAALAAATPVNTGVTSQSWRFELIEEKGHVKLCWVNDNMVEGVPLVILLQYGHGTKNGGYVVGRDFINPAIRPIFDQIANEAWMVVKNS